MKRYKEVQAPVVNTESRSRSAPHSTCNWRRMTTMARVKRFASRIKHKSVRLQTFRRCLPAQNQLADLLEVPQHSATHHKHTRKVSVAQSGTCIHLRNPDSYGRPQKYVFTCPPCCFHLVYLFHYDRTLMAGPLIRCYLIAVYMFI